MKPLSSLCLSSNERARARAQLVAHVQKRASKRSSRPSNASSGSCFFSFFFFSCSSKALARMPRSPLLINSKPRLIDAFGKNSTRLHCGACRGRARGGGRACGSRARSSRYLRNVVADWPVSVQAARNFARIDAGVTPNETELHGNGNEAGIFDVPRHDR